MKRITNKDAAIKIIRILHEQGHQAYLVGGCVRDMLLGRPVNDHDIATSAAPDEIFALFRKTLKVGAQFGVAMVGLGGQWIEVATFRRDESYTDGRHPDRISPGTMEDDAERRDFTINGMYLDPITDAIIDLVGGKIDLENHLIRAIGDPRKRFEEDRLRILRAVRFAAQLSNFNIEPDTALAVRQFAPQITDISAERILEEFRKMLASPGRKIGIKLTDELGLLEHVLPELHALHNQSAKSFTGQNITADAFEQTLAILDRLGRCDFETAMAALLHLVGIQAENPLACQTPLRSRLNIGLFNPSAVLADDIARRLTCSNDERTKIVQLIQFLPLLGRAETLTLAEIKRLKIYRRYIDLHKLFMARVQAELDPREKLDCVETLAGRVNPDTLDQPPLLTGQDLIVEFGLSPSPAFQKILDEIYDAQLNEEIHTRPEALTLVRNRLL
jgi:poly(A) polymerase